MVRLSKQLKIIDVDDKLPLLINFCRKTEDILACFIYGSYGTEYQTPLSDLDIALLLRPGVNWDFKQKLNWICDISNILKEDDTNVVILNEVHLELQYEILASGKILYVRDKVLLADFQEYVVKYFLDYAIDLDMIYMDYEIALRKEYSNDFKE
ncbi:MAG: nucleotidyltransferase domain-containing protein [Bacillota bacterium]